MKKKPEIDPHVKEIRLLLNLGGFTLTQKGRMPPTKQNCSFFIIPAEFKNVFGNPVRRRRIESYVFKHKNKTSHLLVTPSETSDTFWDSKEFKVVNCLTSSFVIINEFIEFLQFFKLEVKK